MTGPRSLPPPTQAVPLAISLTVVSLAACFTFGVYAMTKILDRIGARP